MGKELSFILQEQRTVTLLIGHVKGSDQAVYAYIDYSPSTVDKLIEENPNWLYEELATYQKIQTFDGPILLRKEKPRRFLSSKQMPMEAEG